MNANNNVNIGPAAPKPEPIRSAAARTKKHEPEDLSRWENEGGASSYPAVNDGEKLERLVERLFANGQQTLSHLKVRVEAEVRERPLVAVGIATAVGFLIGGGFRTRQGRKVFRSALQYGLDRFEDMKRD